MEIHAIHAIGLIRKLETILVFYMSHKKLVPRSGLDTDIFSIVSRYGVKAHVSYPFATKTELSVV